MGSLVSKPKAPARLAEPQTIIQQISPSASPSIEAQTPASAATEDNSEDNIVSSHPRVDTLLRRNRGRFGTILTGFRGVLNAHASQQKRKTLLGE